MICPACGKETPSTSNYCIHCGILVQNDTAPTQLLTPEMEKIMFGEDKAGYSEETQKMMTGSKGYTVVSDGGKNVNEPETGRPELEKGSEMARRAGNPVGQNYQSGYSGFSGSSYSDAGKGNSPDYAGAGNGYSAGSTGGGAGSSAGYAGGGAGSSAGYAGGGTGSSAGYAGAGAGSSAGYAGAGNGYSAGPTGGGAGSSAGYTGAGAGSPGGYSDTNNVSTVDPKYAGMDLTPISVLGYIGYSILFAIPVVGLVFMIIYSLGRNRKVNLKNYARSYLIMYIIGFIISLIFFFTFLEFY